MPSVEQHDYLKRLTVMSEIELVREQRENFAELLFIQVQFKSCTQTPGEINEQKRREFSEWITSMEQRIEAVRKEFERRDSLILQIPKAKTRKAKAMPVDVRNN